MRCGSISLLRLQELDAGQHVAGQILGRRVVEVAGRVADAAIVDPQHRDAAAREVVGQHEKRLVAQ